MLLEDVTTGVNSFASKVGVFCVLFFIFCLQRFGCRFEIWWQSIQKKKKFFFELNSKRRFELISNARVRYLFYCRLAKWAKKVGVHWMELICHHRKEATKTVLAITIKMPTFNAHILTKRIASKLNRSLRALVSWIDFAITWMDQMLIWIPFL